MAEAAFSQRPDIPQEQDTRTRGRNPGLRLLRQTPLDPISRELVKPRVAQILPLPAPEKPPAAARSRIGVRAASRPKALAALLAASLCVLGGVQLYAARSDQAADDPGRAAQASSRGALLNSVNPDGPVAARFLRLRWDPAPGAACYRLRVSGLTGDVVVDGLKIQDREWTPPEGALPALSPGEYRWEVEALDEGGRVLARSAVNRLRVAG